MNKRVFRLGAAALAVSFLAACGGGGGASSSYPTTMTTPQMIDVLAGKTWESACYKNPDYPNTHSPNDGPYQKDLIAFKRTGDQTLEERSIEMHYNNATCTGAPIYLDAGHLADGYPEPLRMNTPVKNSQGKWQAALIETDASNNDDVVLLVLTSLTTFDGHEKVGSEMLKSSFKASSENFAQRLKQAKSQP